VQDVDVRILLDGKHEDACRLDINGVKAFDELSCGIEALC
jgi:hypothetical protein